MQLQGSNLLREIFQRTTSSLSFSLHAYEIKERLLNINNDISGKFESP